MGENEDVQALYRTIEIQVRFGGRYESYLSRIVKIDEEKIELLSPMDGVSPVKIPQGSDLILSFTDALETSPKNYHTVVLDQTWNEELVEWILAVTQPEGEKIHIRQFMRHQVTFQVIVRPLTQKEQFKALSVDFSSSGIQLVMESEVASVFPEGTDLKLLFEIHGLGIDYNFEIIGRVMRAWEGLFNAKPARFLGIQFVADYDEDDQQVIMKYILRDFQQIITATERFVPREFLALLEKQRIADVKLGDQVQKEMTILFSDIRAFTTLSEQLSPEENFKFLNSYLSQMEPLVKDHHGFIDKYLGDGIMALFPTSVDHAVHGSIAMLHKLVEYNQGRQKAGYRPIQIGIGLHTGSLILGTIGSQNRMDGTVISDAVNVASRIEEMTKIYGVSLLISDQTYSRLQDASQYAIRVIDRVKPKGKSEAVTIYEVFDGDPPHIIELKKQTQNRFEESLELYRQKKFAEAWRLFEQVLQTNNQDYAASLYVKRCEHFQKYGVPEDWEGIVSLEDEVGLF